MKQLLKSFALLLALAGSAASAQEAQPRGVLLDRIVAVVNENVIMQSELEKEAEQLREMVAKRGTPMPPEEIFMSQVLDRMIGMELQKQFADRVGIKIPDDRVNMAMTEIAQRNGVTLSELPQAMAAEGINYAEFREQVREEMQLTELQRALAQESVSVSPGEVEDELARQAKMGAGQEYKVAHILITVPGEAPPAVIETARQKAEGIRERVASGASFAEMAVTFSDGQQALEGGSLGWRKLPELPTLFANVVTGLQKGETSQPIRSGSGWHLVYLEDVRGRDRVVATETLSRHILLKPNTLRDKAATMKLAQQLANRLRNGEDFATLAKEFSEDPASAAQGGDLGWQPPGVFAERFQEVLDGMQPNEISDPFETQFGIHVAQVLDRRDTDFTENVAKNRAYQEIKRRKAEENFPIWLQKQRDEAHIEIRL